jgi:hypothetical protein
VALKQRDANREALEMAAAMVRDADFEALFADLGDGSEEDDKVLDKAQKYAVRRIEALVAHKQAKR